MLTYILALGVVFASAGLYSATFVLPEVSRKNDLIWSGVGLFYGLVLWVCAGRITGGVLLGQMASVGLIGWLGWQVVQSRWNETPEVERVNADKVKGFRDRLTNLTQSETAMKLKTQAQGVINKAQGAVQDLGVTVETGRENQAEIRSKAPAKTPVVDETTVANVLKRAEVPLTPEDFGNPPKVEIDMTAVKPVMKSFEQPSENSPLGGLFDRAKGWAASLNAPKKNKEVYVRKSKDTVVSESSDQSNQAMDPTTPIDDDFDFGDTVETDGSQLRVTAVANNAIASATEAVKSAADTVAVAIEEVVTEGGSSGTDVTETAEIAVAKSVEVVDEFGDAIVDAVEKRIDGN